MLIPFHSVAMYFCLRWKLSSHPVWTQMWAFYFLIDTCLVLLRKAFITYASLIFCPKSFLMQQESDIGSNNPTPPLKMSERCTLFRVIIVRVFHFPGMRAPVSFTSLYVCFTSLGWELPWSLMVTIRLSVSPCMSVC